jgi:hypothetical protein
MNIIQTLERAAIIAHHRGNSWSDFHQQYSADIHRAEPCDHRAYHRLVCRLLSLVVSGDADGIEPIDAELWLADDTHKPHDTKTQARCLLPLLTIPGVVTADRLAPPDSGSSRQGVAPVGLWE